MRSAADDPSCDLLEAKDLEPPRRRRGRNRCINEARRGSFQAEAGLVPVGPPASVVTLGVTGMSCSACAVSIEKELRAVPGVSSAQVDFEKAKATVRLSTSHPDPQVLVAAVEKAGYHATLLPQTARTADAR
jgi:copper chaperone CopZ